MILAQAVGVMFAFIGTDLWPELPGMLVFVGVLFLVQARKQGRQQPVATTHTNGLGKTNPTLRECQNKT
jgi:hypothetical protein